MYGGIGFNPNNTTARNNCTQLTDDEIGERCQVVLAEIDRCARCDDRYIESAVLHGGVPQTFVPVELRVELEAQLDRLLTEQVLREERLLAIASPIDQNRVETSKSNAESTAEDNSDVCLACAGCCAWTPCCDANALARRRKELYRELKSCEKQAAPTIKSVVARSAINGGSIIHLRSDLHRELTSEISRIDAQLKLVKIDEELHRAYASIKVSIAIRSIHGYDVSVKRNDGIAALEHEHNRHIGQLVAHSIVEDILEW